ncbi:MAG: GNAT family N-acetyltransferase [Ignavibacterium sp.]
MLIKFLNDQYLIRDFQLDDVDALVKYANNYNIFRWVKDNFPYPYSIRDAEQLITVSRNTNDGLNYAIANQKELIGGIGVKFKEDVYRYSWELGYWLGEPFWGKGIATEAVKVFTKYLFSHYNIRSITANVYEGNKASMKVLTKAGFKLDGVIRKAVFKEKLFWDLYVYSILREEVK